MTAGQVVLLAVAGLAAGAVNTLAGGGSLISFPALVGVSPSALVANVTNTVGLIPGYLGGSVGYRTELAGQGRRLRLLTVDAAAGSVAGVAILLNTPADVFRVAVPYLVALACLLVLAQPRLSARLRAREESRGTRTGGWVLHVAVVVGSVYGGYFGAGLGVMFLGLLGLLVDDDLQRLNALKGVLSLVVNLVAGICFAVFGPVHWGPAGVVAVAAVVGGYAGARVARRVPANVLRIGVAVFGLTVALILALRS